MRRIHIFLVLLLTTLTLSITRTADAQRWNWDSEASAMEFRSFDAFLHDHPWIAKKLWEKPQRVNDMGFLNGNKELKQWLEDHPAAARAFHEDPIGFMERERHFQIYGADFAAGNGGRSELARFDWFLDGHPDVRHDLMRRPELVDKYEYLQRHPELGEFLRQHPAVRAELLDNPREFMEREARYERGM